MHARLLFQQASLSMAIDRVRTSPEDAMTFIGTCQTIENISNQIKKKKK